MSQAQFDKAVEIVRLPKGDSPIQPSQEDQLFVRSPCQEILILN